MAWVAEENFESYSAGDLNGGNGGSGWSAAWSGSTNYDVQTSVVYQGSNAVANTTNANADISRTLTSATSSGVVYFTVRRNDTGSTGQFQYQFRDSGSGVVFKIVMDAGNITLTGSSSTNIVTGYSADTWYGIRITYSGLGGTPSVTAATNTGSGWSAESSDVGATNNAAVDTVTISIDALGAGNNVYFDVISASDPILVAYTMIAAAGSFILTGIAATLAMGQGIIASVGAFTLTGIDTTLNSTRSIVASVGSFTLTGIATGLNYGYKIVASVGSFITSLKIIMINFWNTEDSVSTSWTDESSVSSTWTEED